MTAQDRSKIPLIILLTFLFPIHVISRSFWGDKPTLYHEDTVRRGDRKPLNYVKNSDMVNVLAKKVGADNIVNLGITQDDEDNSLSFEEIELIKQRILDGLGMKSIPTKSLSNFTQEEIDMAYREYERAVEEEEAKYMEELEAEEDELNEEEEEEEDKRKEAGGNNKTISSYTFYSKRISRRVSGRGRRNANGGEQLVHFSVSLPLSTEFNNTNSIIEATSRFWKRGNSKNNSAKQETITVTFYRLDDIPRGKHQFDELNPAFMESKNVSAYGNEWLEIDMTEAVKKWAKNSGADTGILIKCQDCAAAGVKFLTGSRRKGLKSSSKVPRLDVRTEIVGLRRIKRSHKIRKSFKKNFGQQADCFDATHPRGKKSKRCCRRSMQVRFADLPRFGFILSPKEFDAYYCSGRCPPRYNPASQHALFQSLVNLRGETNVPKPCCAPTKLKALNILHIGEDGLIKTTTWSDVIVTECGCA